MGIARRGLVYQETTRIATAALQAWHTTPIEIAQTPGVGRIIEPIRYSMQLKAGTAPFSASGGGLSSNPYAMSIDGVHGIMGTGLSTGGLTLLGSVADRLYAETVSYVAADLSGSTPDLLDPSANSNLPLFLIGGADLAGGQIATTSLNAAGTGYAVNDTGHIIQGSNTSATYRVDTVVSVNHVATFTITDPGNGYTVANGLATDASGGGTGFKVNILTANKGNGSLIVTVFYGVTRLS